MPAMPAHPCPTETQTAGLPHDGYYSAVTATDTHRMWVNLKTLTLRERSPAKQSTYCTKEQIFAETDSRSAVAWGKGKEWEGRVRVK